MKTLILCQVIDLEGTSEGIVSNSFIIKYLKLFPEQDVEIVWISERQGIANLSEKLNFDLKTIQIRKRYYTWIENKANGFLNQFLNFNFKDKHKINNYKNAINQCHLYKYDQIFVRSGGLGFELIRALHGNNYLNKMILYFHDPYPPSIYPGSNSKFSKSEYFKIKEMRAIVQKAKAVFSPSKKLSADLGFLFGRRFKTLPHQFDKDIFNNYNTNKNESLDEDYLYIMYHGAIQHNRNLDLVLKAFTELVDKNPRFEKFKFVIRSKGKEVNHLKKLYDSHKHIMFLKNISAYDSYMEQKKYASLSLILETNGEYSNILGGKVPLLVSFNANILCLTSRESELKRLLKHSNKDYVEYDFNSIEKKLKLKLSNILDDKEYQNPMINYFSDVRFKQKISKLVKNNFLY